MLGTKGSFSDRLLSNLTNIDFTDPDTICPYCYEPMPAIRSPTLLTLLTQARKHARLSPRITNSKGLTAPVERYVDVCQRHSFETELLPHAIAQGWPQEIEFERVPERVKGEDILAVLRGVVQRPERSWWWNEVLNDVKKGGRRAVVGVQGQFATFDRALPG
jgi:hypothetical protein